MKQRIAGVYLSVVCLMIGASSVGAQDWPQWRGPNRDAKATGFKAPASWPKELTQKWKVTLGDGVATPAVVGDKLYTFSRQDNKEVIRCLDAGNGEEIWKDEYEAQPATGAAASFPGPRSSPTVADGKVITFGVRGALSCFDAESGKKLWRKDDYHASPQFFTSSSPIVVNGLCIAQEGGQKNGALVAHDLSTGEEKWKWTGDSPAYASPVLMTVDGTKLIIAMTQTKIIAVNATDGKEVWQTPFVVQGRGYNAATPMVDGQTLIFTGSARGVTAVRLSKEGDKIVHKELWKNPDQSVMFSTPVIKDGYLYGLSQANEFFCINTQDGKTAWGPAAKPSTGSQPGQGLQPVKVRPSGGGTEGAQKSGGGQQPSGGQPGGGGARGRGGRGGGMRGSAGYGSIVDAGSVLIALTPTGQLVVFEPNPKEFKEVAKYKVADKDTYAYPVVSGNRIYTKDTEALTLWTVP